MGAIGRARRGRGALLAAAMAACAGERPVSDEPGGRRDIVVYFRGDMGIPGTRRMLTNHSRGGEGEPEVGRAYPVEAAGEEIVRNNLGLIREGLERPVEIRVITPDVGGGRAQREAVREILAIPPEERGRVVLAGYSYGGVTALDAAALLGRLGVRVDLLVTLDAASFRSAANARAAEIGRFLAFAPRDLFAAVTTERLAPANVAAAVNYYQLAWTGAPDGAMERIYGIGGYPLYPAAFGAPVFNVEDPYTPHRHMQAWLPDAVTQIRQVLQDGGAPREMAEAVRGAPEGERAAYGDPGGLQGRIGVATAPRLVVPL